MSKGEDFCFLSATEISRKIKEKEVSPVEVTRAFIERIEAVNPKVNAFCTLTFEQAIEQAKEAEAAVMRGEETGPLHGIPLAIKDLTLTKGIRTTFGSLAFSDYVPQEDCLVVKRMKQSGAIILGKTNTPEFGHKGTTDNLLFGPTRNPWNLEMTAGGSSGGSAAAVAAGLVPIAEGSDGGGSIRIPASACGIFGFKPTYGRIPFTSKPDNMFGSQNPFLHYGPLARTVEDAALLFSVMAGPDSCDPFCLPDTGENFLEELRRDITGLKIAYSPDLDIYEVDVRVRQAMDKAVSRLEQLGCSVEEVELGLKEHAKAIRDGFARLWTTNLASGYGSLLEEKRHLLCEEVVKMIERGFSVRAVDYKQVELVRTTVYRKVQHVLDQYDLLVTPTLTVPPFPYQWRGPSQINGKKINPAADWMMTSIFNLTGHPVASIPVDFIEDQLPVGMQVVGNRLADSLILRFSRHYEMAFPWTDRRPQL